MTNKGTFQVCLLLAAVLVAAPVMAKAPAKRAKAAKPVKATKVVESTRSAALPAGPLAADLLAQRAELSGQLIAGEVRGKEETALVKKLTAIAGQTLLSSKVVEGDPLAYTTQLRKGETLAAAVKRCGCGVPASFIAKINGVSESYSRTGATVKMLRGPFHARISKHDFSLDVYLKSGKEMIFVKRVKVALGRNDSTPLGTFRITGKAVKATWTPPKSMRKTHPKPVKWGQKGYPLGRDGIFMGLRGIDKNTRGAKGYGIHSTNSQGSIGQARSHGCVRVGNGDIGSLYSMFTDGATTVQIVP